MATKVATKISIKKHNKVFAKWAKTCQGAEGLTVRQLIANLLLSPDLEAPVTIYIDNPPPAHMQCSADIVESVTMNGTTIQINATN